MQLGNPLEFRSGNKALFLIVSSLVSLSASLFCLDKSVALTIVVSGVALLTDLDAGFGFTLLLLVPDEVLDVVGLFEFVKGLNLVELYAVLTGE